MGYLSREIRLENLLNDSVFYGRQAILYNGWKDIILGNSWNTNYDNFLICGNSITWGYTIILNYNTISMNNSILAFYYKEGDLKFEDIYFDDQIYFDSISSLINNQCTKLFKNSSYELTDYAKYSYYVSNSSYDDLKFSKHPSEFIISMFYLFIPIILFLLGIKVLKKGFFR